MVHEGDHVASASEEEEDRSSSEQGESSDEGMVAMGW